MTLTVATTPTAAKEAFPKGANWIWLEDFDDAAAAGQFVLFRKTYHLDTIPDQPVAVRVSADTRYRLFVNGQSVSFGPCKSYLEHWYYETVEDIRPFLKQGENVLAARVLRFSSSYPGCMSMIRSALPGFILACTFGDSSHDDISYDDSEWSTAIIKTGRRKMSPLLHPHRLVPRDIPAMTEDFARFEGITKQTGTETGSDWTQLLAADVPIVLPANSTNIVDIQADVSLRCVNYQEGVSVLE